MNYKSQLRGWAIDRVIELWKIRGETADMPALQSEANQLADYAYIPREDLESTAKDLFELVRNAPAGESSIDALVGTLEHIKAERISQGIDKAETMQ